MKVALIIPLHDQAIYWEKILRGIKSQTRLPDAIYIVVDRPHLDRIPDCVTHICNLNSSISIDVKMLRIDTPPIIQRNADKLFLAGYARNIGLQEAIKDGCDCFVFIDGDCIPQKELIRSHEILCSYDLPVISIGRRRETKYRGLDSREHQPNLTHLNLFGRTGTLINNPDLIKQCLIVWSCNIGLNLKAVSIIQKFNKKYYEREELFNSDFNGAWGGEDSFLGITAWYCRIFMHTIGEPKSGVEHIDHPRPETVYTVNHKQFFEEKCNLLKKKIAINPMNLDIFT